MQKEEESTISAKNIVIEYFQDTIAKIGNRPDVI
jgi:hypothetical protein